MPLLRGRSLRRKLNSILMGLQIRARSSVVRSYPRHMVLDLINICGLNCPICPQGQGKIKRAPASIDLDYFSALMEKFGPFLYTLTLTNWGEPFLYPRLAEALRIARKYPIYIGFSTNLQKLPSDIDGILLSGIDEIGCSIDGASAAAYAKYRIGGDFSRAIDAMKLLVEKRNALGLKIPKIRWQVLLNRYTEPETDSVISAAEMAGVDSVVFLPIYVDIANMFTQSPQKRFENDRDWLPADENLSWYDYSSGRLKNPPKICTRLWDTLVIHPDGAISPCCAVIDPKDDFGKLKNVNDFWEVWNGPRFRSARNLLKRKPRKLDEKVVCSKCVEEGILIL
jgi:radical SAM protein with 4Fe4S-binding SPASM domain